MCVEEIKGICAEFPNMWTKINRINYIILKTNMKSSLSVFAALYRSCVPTPSSLTMEPRGQTFARELWVSEGKENGSSTVMAFRR